MKIIPFHKSHYRAVAAIYSEGLKTGIASFETTVPSWEEWNTKFLKVCRFVATIEGRVSGWCAISLVSPRDVYKGVAEDSVYVSEKFRNRGIGKTLLLHLIAESEKAGFWTLQAGIFPQNITSIKLHQNCGFRIIGTREKIAKRDDKWYDNVIMERRSKKLI
ncbi:GNAT family N-acetyltransferase [Constantimarinum furrinae]|uniref:Phosphinothricin acetyltransferase n=1 Tax=Constantimarinum furrinae TaxID=2562285 RepID=A0A7G8PTL5_9FLAO|nr:GNAT family N-acetyltransferase [Constantimarinum furrinae]QNJ97681.1 phosphinothricin acetyltransferase [Constantimarinum furrinae]